MVCNLFLVINLKKDKEKKSSFIQLNVINEAFMINLIVYNCGAVIMKSTQRRYRIKRRKFHIFLDWELFNPRMNSFFITLFLKTDPELQNDDIMVREVERLLYLNTHFLGFKKNQATF